MGAAVRRSTFPLRFQRRQRRRWRRLPCLAAKFGNAGQRGRRRGDADGDGDVDQNDLAGFETCCPWAKRQSTRRAGTVESAFGCCGRGGVETLIDAASFPADSKLASDGQFRPMRLQRSLR